MPVDPQNVINSPLGLSIALQIGKFTPTWLGHRLTNFAADRLAARKDWNMIRVVRLNQWVVHDGKLDTADLDDAVRRNFRNTARSIFDLYHNINNPDVFYKIVDVHPIAEQLLHRPEYSDRGLVVAGIHMSNFDFIGQAAGITGVKAMFLAMPDNHPWWRSARFSAALRWFVHTPEDEAFLRTEVHEVFDAPAASELHRDGFVERCARRADRLAARGG